MKRMLLVIFALLLLIDLADDGCFGKADVDPYHNHANTAIISLCHSQSVKIAFQHEDPLANLSETHSHPNFASIYFRAQPTLKKIIIYSKKSSSGGIPL